jgi:hypothetical protein
MPLEPHGAAGAGRRGGGSGDGRARRAWVVIYRCMDVAVTYGESSISRRASGLSASSVRRVGEGRHRTLTGPRGGVQPGWR